MRFLVRRAAFALALVFLTSSASLFLVRLAPGDFVTQSLGTRATPSEAARLRAELGLDRSPLQQYAHWLGQVARLDFGRSFADARPVSAVVAERMLNTAMVAVLALVLATTLGIATGTVTGSRPDSWPAAVVNQLSLVLVAMPPLLTSLLLVFIAARTQWLPVSGMRSAAGTGGAWDVMRHLMVPVLALALPMAASLERLHARAVRDTLTQPFILAARARGVGRGRLVWQATLKPALRTVASVYGLAIAAVFSGSFAVEVVTAWPGLGRLLVDALAMRDLYLVAGCAVAGSLLLALATVVADALLIAVDPRAAD